MRKLLLIVTIFTLCGYSQCRKNVLFLMADDLRPNIGAYNGPNSPSPVHPQMHTPNIDALASRSLLLKRAYVQVALCSPSRSSLLTGRRPDTTRVYDLDHYFRHTGNFTTLPQYFKNKGYRSIGMGKIFHPGHASGHDDPLSWSEPFFHGVRHFESNSHSWLAVPDANLVHTPLKDRQVADHAIQKLKQVAPDAKSGRKNFFMAVGFHKPHLPFVFPKSIMDKYYPSNSIHLPPNPYAPRFMPDIAWINYGELRNFADVAALHASGNINTTLPDYKVVQLRRAYYSAITWMDSLVGEVIAELENLGLSDNTVIVFASDHGYQLGEHGEWCKHTNFDIALHAPLMIRVPHRTDAGISTDQIVEFVDIFPTVVEAAGFSPISQCHYRISPGTKLCHEGISLLPLIDNPNTPLKNAAFSQYYRHNRVMGYTMRTDKYRYTEWINFDFKTNTRSTPHWQQIQSAELYDHTIDPEENVNRANYKSYHDIRANLRTQLHRGWLNAFVDPSHGSPQLIG
ncbi:hypothetical protein ACF0H5_010246 [Mactra antiquata]